MSLNVWSHRGALLALLLASWEAPAAPARDGWFDQDKPKHFVISLSLAGLGYGAGAALSDSRPVRCLTGAGLALGVGLGKELYDASQGRPFSYKDLAWDAAGTAVGLGLAWLLDTLLGTGGSQAFRLLPCTGVRPELSETRE